MSWAKVDDKLHAHLKAVRAGEAMALWVLALSWCVAYLTDGELPEEQPSRLIGRRGPRMAAKLVEVGLWEKSEFGYRFHDWFDYQPARASVEAKRDEAKTRMQRIRGLAGDVRANTTRTDGEHIANTSRSSREVRDSRPVPDPSRPVPTPTEEEKRDASRLTGERASAPAHVREGSPVQPPSAPAKPAKPRQATTPLPDPVPAAGTPARRLYDAIVGDRVLGPITGGPGDLAERLCAEGAYPGVDVLAEIRKAGAWAAGQPVGHWRDGRKAILGWLARAEQRAASTPKPSPASVLTTHQPERIDYQGRRIVPPAPLPSGDVWEVTDRDEEEEAFARIRARTQPKGVSRG